jgi:hypothetical protein
MSDSDDPQRNNAVAGRSWVHHAERWDRARCRARTDPECCGIRLEPGAYLVAYLLAGAEIGFAVLSFGGSRTTDARTLRLIVWSCIAFHASSAALETYAYIRGLDPLILGNVVARLVIVALFAYALSGLRSSPSIGNGTIGHRSIAPLDE